MENSTFTETDIAVTYCAAIFFGVPIIFITVKLIQRYCNKKN